MLTFTFSDFFFLPLVSDGFANENIHLRWADIQGYQEMASNSYEEKEPKGFTKCKPPWKSKSSSYALNSWPNICRWHSITHQKGLAQGSDFEVLLVAATVASTSAVASKDILTGTTEQQLLAVEREKGEYQIIDLS